MVREMVDYMVRGGGMVREMDDCDGEGVVDYMDKGRAIRW